MKLSILIYYGDKSSEFHDDNFMINEAFKASDSYQDQALKEIILEHP